KILNLVGLLMSIALMITACGGEAATSTPGGTTAPTQPPATAATATAAPLAPIGLPSPTAMTGGPSATLTYWNGFTASDRPVMENNVAVFNATHPNIQIKMDIQPWDTIFQKL